MWCLGSEEIQARASQFRQAPGKSRRGDNLGQNSAGWRLGQTQEFSEKAALGKQLVF